ncbi:hypothetical protein ES703_74386 [subsurface metagenome]
MNSVVSPKIQVPPLSISKSQVAPADGLAAKPEVVSEAPHFTPSTNSESANSSLLNFDALATIACAKDVPRATAALAPPIFWITTISTGLPDLAIPAATWSAKTASQPRLTINTPARLGFHPREMRVRVTWSRSGWVWPQP